MAASFPGAVKNFSAAVNGVTKLVASLYNLVYDEVTAIETELGTDPAGSYADVKTRLNSTTAFASHSDKSASYAAQQAATDGVVEGYADFTNAGSATIDISISLYTDSNADPTTLISKVNFYEVSTNVYIGQKWGQAFSMSVKRGDYWKVVVSGSPTTLKVFWRPIGA